MRNKTFIFDTNTLISVFLLRNSIPKVAFNKAKSLGQIIVCQNTYDELCNVLIRPKFDSYISLETRLFLLEDFKDLVIFREPTNLITACRDPKDDIYLSLAVEVEADCIITGDKDLLILNPFQKIPILNAADFLKSF